MKGMKIVLIFMLLMTAGLFHILFTMFDYGFNNPDTGAFTALEEQMNETLTGDYQDSAYDLNVMMRQFFGIGRVVIVGICVVVIAFIIFDRNPSGS